MYLNKALPSATRNLTLSILRAVFSLGKDLDFGTVAYFVVT